VLARYRRAAIAVVPALLVAGAISALTGTADARTADSSLARGQQTQQCQSSSSARPSCGFATELQLPLAIAVTAEASPENGQNATVSWTVSCSVNGGSPTSSSGTKTGPSPFRAQLTLPKSEDGDCTVNATATLDGSGELTGILTYTLGEQVMIAVNITPTVASGSLFKWLCLTDAKQGRVHGAKAVLANCTSIYVDAWTYNGKTLVHGGLCLTDPHNGWVGTALVLEPCAGSANQTWTYTGAGQGSGPFVLKSPRLCLDDPKDTQHLGTPLSIYSCNGAPNEAWTLSS
jgi:hypothetical protein